ncbi:MAG: hypothetical protein KTR20_00810 [Cellvibrionaceae bacterium]|nr:hypothetical protein [Cellvibrionaceae bacterium]
MTAEVTAWCIGEVDAGGSAPLTKEAICGNDPLLLEAYAHLHFQWIGIDDYTRLVAQLFTKRIFYHSTPAIVVLLQAGLQAYGKLLNEPNNAYYPHQLLKQFLTASLASAKKVCCFVVIDRQKKAKWSVMNDLPFSLWGVNRAALHIESLQINDSDFTRALYQKVVPKNIKLVMRRFNHEHAIMAGDVDYCH